MRTINVAVRENCNPLAVVDSKNGELAVTRLVSAVDLDGFWAVTHVRSGFMVAGGLSRARARAFVRAHGSDEFWHGIPSKLDGPISRPIGPLGDALAQLRHGENVRGAS